MKGNIPSIFKFKSLTILCAFLISALFKPMVCLSGLKYCVPFLPAGVNPFLKKSNVLSIALSASDNASSLLTNAFNVLLVAPTIPVNKAPSVPNLILLIISLAGSLSSPLSI